MLLPLIGAFLGGMLMAGVIGYTVWEYRRDDREAKETLARIDGVRRALAAVSLREHRVITVSDADLRAEIPAEFINKQGELRVVAEGTPFRRTVRLAR